MVKGKSAQLGLLLGGGSGGLLILGIVLGIVFLFFGGIILSILRPFNFLQIIGAVTLLGAGYGFIILNQKIPQAFWVVGFGLLILPIFIGALDALTLAAVLGE